MQYPSQSAERPAPPCPGEAQSRWQREDLTYQAVTVVAMLLVLCSLWVF